MRVFVDEPFVWIQLSSFNKNTLICSVQTGQFSPIPMAIACTLISPGTAFARFMKSSLFEHIHTYMSLFLCKHIGIAIRLHYLRCIFSLDNNNFSQLYINNVILILSVSFIFFSFSIQDMIAFRTLVRHQRNAH